MEGCVEQLRENVAWLMGELYALWVHCAVSEEPLGASERCGPEQQRGSREQGSREQGSREDAEIQELYMIFSSPNERIRSSGTSEPGYLEAELGLLSGS